MRRCVAIAALLLGNAAYAGPWVVDPAASHLTFEGSQAGETFTGAFTRFESVIDFAETAPEKGRIAITVDMASATVEGKNRQDSLPTNDWFATDKFPKAQFVSQSIRATGARQFAADGTLTIRGVSHPLTLPFTLKPHGGSTLAEGSVTLSRNAYGIGQGQWAGEQWVAYPVTVRYRIVAAPRAE